jgi:hypothetical protein
MSPSFIIFINIIKEIKMKFREYLNEGRMDKSIQKKLESADTITTNDSTQSLWYSSKTSYKIDRVDDGHYSKKPGIWTIVNKEDKFIPLIDIKI